jgi:hypothetical protein
MNLPDQALVRLVTCAPALPAAAASALIRALETLGQQFVREQRCAAFTAQTACAGHLLVLAWDGPALSGCSHDKLNRLFAELGPRHGVDLLGAPPLVIAVDQVWTCTDRAGLRAAAGRITAVADTRCATLGAWRSAGIVPLAQSWLAALAVPKPL